MTKQDAILIDHLCEQIAFEEQLYRNIEDQLAEINETEFADAKEILTNTSKILELHFKPLNELLDKLETEELNTVTIKASNNGDNKQKGLGVEKKKIRTSIHLREVYAALNLITINNTLLHTLALALNHSDIAETSLKHLENLAPISLMISDLLPKIITRELQAQDADIDSSIALTSLTNTQSAWRNASKKSKII